MVGADLANHPSFPPMKVTSIVCASRESVMYFLSGHAGVLSDVPPELRVCLKRVISTDYPADTELVLIIEKQWEVGQV